MEDIIKEIRQDMKTVLMNQARMQEKMSNHSEEMHEHKESTAKEFEGVQKQIDPMLKAFQGIKWMVGAILISIPIVSLYLKLKG